MLQSEVSGQLVLLTVVFCAVQFVFVSLAGWGALFYGGYRFFTGGSKKEAPVKVEVDAKKDTSSGHDKAGKH